jgi:uncharacterized protein
MNISHINVWITGANGGIGLAFAKKMASEKNHLVLVVRRSSSINIDELKKLGAPTVKIIEADLSNTDDVTRLCAELDNCTVDIIFNNAGLLTGGLLEEQSDLDIQNMYMVNIVALTRLTRAAVATMTRANKGLIINNASISGKVYFPCATTYAASKAAVVALTESLRRELWGTNVKTLLLITPGIKTNMFDKIDNLYGNHISLPMSSVSPESFAQSIYCAIQKQESSLYPSGSTGMVLRMSQHLPWLFDLFVKKIYKRFPTKE